jgi:hypothetical protein
VLFMLAAAALALGDRPADLLGDRSQSDYRAWLQSEAIRREPFASAQPPCQSAKVEELGWRPGPQIEADETYAKAPAVYEKLRFSGCGRASVQNMLVSRLQSGEWRSAGLMPGDSRADLTLQTDVAKVWFSGVQADAPDACKGEDWGRFFRRGEVKVEQEADPETGAWEELWPATHCDQDRSIRVTFTPNAEKGGTEFRIQALWRKTA